MFFWLVFPMLTRMMQVWKQLPGMAPGGRGGRISIRNISRLLGPGMPTVIVERGNRGTKGYVFQ